MSNLADPAANPIDQHVGGRVRLRRKLLGLSQESLAQGLGITFQQVQKYERGANRISASRLYEIAALLNVSVTFFFDGLAAPGSPPCPALLSRSAALSHFLGEDDAGQWVETIAQIRGQALRRKVLAFLRTVADLDTEADPKAVGADRRASAR